MSYFTVTLLIALISAPFRVEAAAPTPSSCIKAHFRGVASTYNPFKPGWKTGGGQVATGGRYNPNGWDAALQLDLAKKYRCGYGSGKICHAIVSAPNGRAAIIKINDNGPLVKGRIIDLNEKSMRYLSGGASGSNSGLINNVSVMLLCALDNQYLGPINPADREAWNKKIIDTPVDMVSQSSSYVANNVGNSAQPFPTYPSPNPSFLAPPQQQQSAQPGSSYAVPRPVQNNTLYDPQNQTLRLDEESPDEPAFEEELQTIGEEEREMKSATKPTVPVTVSSKGKVALTTGEKVEGDLQYISPTTPPLYGAPIIQTFVPQGMIVVPPRALSFADALQNISALLSQMYALLTGVPR